MYMLSFLTGRGKKRVPNRNIPFRVQPGKKEKYAEKGEL